MKVRYKGLNIIPIGLARNIFSPLTTNEIYEVVDEFEKNYLVIDENNETTLVPKEKCEVIEDESN